MKKIISMLLTTALFAVAVSVQAALTLSLSTDGINWTTVEDGSAADGIPMADAVNYVGTLDSWDVVVSTGILTDSPPWTLHLDTVALGVGTLYAMLTTTNVDLNAHYSVQNSYTTNGSVDLTAYIGADNATPTSLADLDSLYELSQSGFTSDASGACVDGGTAGGLTPTGEPTGEANTCMYSVTLLATITHTNWGVSSFDHEVEIPTPGTLALLGLGLLGFGFAKRRSN